MSFLEVEDDEIIAGKSPYSAHHDEELVYDGRSTPISIEHVMFQIKRGKVIPIDYVILDAISEMQFASSRMITKHINDKGIGVEQSKVMTRLKAMSRLGIVSRYRFKNSENETNLRIYCMEKVAKLLLLSRNYPCRWDTKDNLIPLAEIKEKLARNQVLLSFREKLSNLTDSKVSSEVGNVNRIRPHISLTTETPNGPRFYFVQAFRSYEGYKEQAYNTLQLYKDYYAGFSPTPEIVAQPALIICCEDDEHALNIHKILLKMSGQDGLGSHQVIYTTDLRVLKPDLSEGLFKFEIEGRTAKITLLDKRIFEK